MKRTAFVCAALAAVLTGCGGGGSPPSPSEVRGTVLLDGVPMAEGEVQFLDLGGEQAPAFLTVKNGAFEGPVPNGKKRVQIQSFKKGKLPSGEEDPIGVNVVHSDFNTNSQLTAEVSGSGVTPAEFRVKSVKGR